MERNDQNYKLGFYRAAVDFVALADRISAAFPRGRAYLTDQLRRAATSIMLNVAEGAGEFAKLDKARFYRMAIRSGTECQAIIDIVDELRLASIEDVARARELLRAVIGMLTVTVRRFDDAAEGQGQGFKGLGRGKGRVSGRGRGRG